jgi:DNA mismatch endonuclease, patch repair protein
MVDMFSKEQRSKKMKAIRSKGTSLENIVTKELWKRGLRFRKNVRKLMGNPDIAIQKYKTAIFLDSCFWHSCPIHGNKPKSNVEYWKKKLKRNIDRDNEVSEYFQNKGWNILRVWEHDVKYDLVCTIENILNFIMKAKQK